MELKLSENIRSFRKQKGLTQEQLAETFGVTIGAVSKWESGASIPDILILMDMARFFEVSMDVLLGYELVIDSEDEYVARIRTLRNERRFNEAVSECSMALHKYPNHFPLVHHSAFMYMIAGIDTGKTEYYDRSTELYEHSLKLISQNKDPNINEWTIRNEIARLCLYRKETEKALELLKANNAGGFNDEEIGELIATEMGQPQEGLEYLTSALVNTCGRMLRITLAYLNVYEKLEDFEHAVDICDMELQLLRSLRIEGERSHLDMEIVEILTAKADFYHRMGNKNTAESVLKEAFQAAVYFDAAPDNSFDHIRFSRYKVSAVAFDDFGKNAVSGVLSYLEKQENTSDLIDLWNQWTGEREV